MKITRIAYLGPLASKNVSGVGNFPKGVPTDVSAHKAKSILSYWPGMFAAVLPCAKCDAPGSVEAPIEIEPEEVPDEAEEATINKGGRPKKQ